MQKLYPNLHALLENCLLEQEDPNTEALIEKLRHVKSVGSFTQAEFLEMCKWKDPRELRRRDLKSNTEAYVNDISRQVFASADEYRRIILLDSLRGVGVPVSSAILTLTDPENYGVIDIRVWQILHLYGEVSYDPEGKNLQLRHWMDYLPLLRALARDFEMSARCIEWSIFEHHRSIQEGSLYG